MIAAYEMAIFGEKRKFERVSVSSCLIPTGGLALKLYLLLLREIGEENQRHFLVEEPSKTDSPSKCMRKLTPSRSPLSSALLRSKIRRSK